MMRDEIKPVDVKFSAKRKPYNNCCCSTCFALGEVTVLTYPISKLYGGHAPARSKYFELWLCDSCRNKLIAALKAEEISTWTPATGTIPSIITNADRIRAMTDEELANYLWGVERICYGDPKFIGDWLNWLRQEAGEE